MCPAGWGTLAHREVGLHGKWELSGKPREWLTLPRVQGLNQLPVLLPTLSTPPPTPWAARTSGQQAGWERQLCRPPACCRGLTGTATVCGGRAPGSLVLSNPRRFNFLLPRLLTFMFKACSYSFFSALC